MSEEPLTPEQQGVSRLLSTGASINEAAAFVGVHRNTIANWRRTVPAFAREFHLAARERALFWQEQASDLAPQALEILRAILHNPEASPSVQLRAALAVVKMATAPVPEQPCLLPGPTELKPDRTDTVAAQILEMQPLRRQSDYNAQSCTTQPTRRLPEPGRNSLCPCGSGVKYKRCCSVNPVSPQSAAALPPFQYGTSAETNPPTPMIPACTP